MEISAIDQEVSDFDWFAVDQTNCLVHFSSVGGRLPDSVAASKENLELLTSYFWGLPFLFSKEELYVATTIAPFPYLEYALRGIVSYCVTITAWPMETTYEIVARPPRALTLADLPAAIATLVSQTCLPFAVADMATLDTSTVA